MRVLRARGSVRNKQDGRDVVFTGPRMRVCYSGCRWNTVVFAVDENQADFKKWLENVYQNLETTVRTDPPFFKVSPRGTPSFNTFIIQPSSNPELYAPELRCRLSTVRGDLSSEPVSNACLMDAKSLTPVEPAQVISGSFMTPVFKLGYFKEGENFGLTLTVLKAQCEPNPIHQMSNDVWEMDTSSS